MAAVPAAVRDARRHAWQVLDGWGVPGELVADAQLLATELLANAVQATVSVDPAEPVALWLLANRRRLIIGVRDCHPDDPVPQKVPDDEAECGRGLVIVDELASRWGTRRLGAKAKTVWAELLLPPPPVSAEQGGGNDE